RYNEIALKKGNRRRFEDLLCRQIDEKLTAAGLTGRLRRTWGRIFLYCSGPAEAVEACLGGTPGVASYSRGFEIEKTPDFFQAAGEAVKIILGPDSDFSFKIETRREDKKFPMNSLQISREFGGYIFELFRGCRVDVHSPQYRIDVEIRDGIFISAGKSEACGGLPVGTAGRVLPLLSGGIDSPVAGKMLMVRGLSLAALHFTSYPFTSHDAEEKVRSLSIMLKRYDPALSLYFCNILDIQKQIKSHCAERYFTVLLRRAMMRIASLHAHALGIPALATGESVGQVASQTIEGLVCSDDVADCPVLRPCIGLNKEMIIAQAQAIGTFTKSIEPHADCCTLFSPRHPATHPLLADVEAQEKLIPGYFEMIMAALPG
ncbi:MAG: tRNA uracil 4-sulfurtransferase ThiI, partial [Thermodesulfobacteriota bacterium]